MSGVTDIFNLTDTWDNAGEQFTAIKMDVAKSAAASGSKLLDLLLNSVSKFSVAENGQIVSGPLTFPITDGTAGQALVTNGSGALSWGSVSSASPFTVTGNSSAGAEIRLPEDTDNGSNYVGFKAPDSLAANVVYTLPSADGTNGQALVTNGSKVLSWATIGAAAPLTLASGTLTADGNALTITQTLNNGAVDFSGALKIRTTKTAAGDSSGLFSAAVSGNSFFGVNLDGTLVMVGTTSETGGWAIKPGRSDVGSDFLMFGPVGNVSAPSAAGNNRWKLEWNRLTTHDGAQIGWANGGVNGSSSNIPDTALARNAAGVVEINNGTNGTLRDLIARNVRTSGVAVGSLAAASTAGAGARAFVTDSSVTTFGSTVSGGGANGVPVYSDGTNWKVG